MRRGGHRGHSLPGVYRVARVKVGAYELEAEIGRGGMGIVYRSRAPDGRPVAVKVLPPTDAEKRARFEREQRLLGSFTEEDGFVPLLDSGNAPAPYLVMPFVAGGTLRKLLEGGPLGIQETLELGVVLARSLGRAHERGIVHRDMKPENVLFTKVGWRCGRR